MPRTVKALATLEVGGESSSTGGGAIRSSKASRSARRAKASPYSRTSSSPMKAAVPPGPPTTGLSSAIGGMGIVSATRTRASSKNSSTNKFAVDVAVPRGCGGARGPIERQLANEALFREKHVAEERERRQQAREAARIMQATGGRPVEVWRDAAAESFLSRPSAVPAPYDPVSISSSSSAALAKPQPQPQRLPPLPPLPAGCAQNRGRRKTTGRFKPGFEGLVSP